MIEMASLPPRGLGVRTSRQEPMALSGDRAGARGKLQIGGGRNALKTLKPGRGVFDRPALGYVVGRRGWDCQTTVTNANI